MNQYVNQSYPIYQNNLNSGYGGMMPMSGMEQLQKPLFQQGQEEQMFDEAGFEDAFAQASKEAHDIATEDVSPNLARDEQRETSGSDLLHKDPIQIHPEHSDTEYDLPALSKMPSPVQYRIGSDAIPYKEQKARTIDQDNRDADELARTAGQLLNSVQHDTSDKFQNSQFLSLMRKIRDGKVRVQGEEFRAINDINNPVSNSCDLIMNRLARESEIFSRRPWLIFTFRVRKDRVDDIQDLRSTPTQDVTTTTVSPSPLDDFSREFRYMDTSNGVNHVVQPPSFGRAVRNDIRSSIREAPFPRLRLRLRLQLPPLQIIS